MRESLCARFAEAAGQVRQPIREKLGGYLNFLGVVIDEEGVHTLRFWVVRHCGRLFRESPEECLGKKSKELMNDKRYLCVCVCVRACVCVCLNERERLEHYESRVCMYVCIYTGPLFVEKPITSKHERIP